VAIHYPKEQMHRIKYTKLSSERISAKLAAASAGPACLAGSSVLAGKTLRIATDDGPVQTVPPLVGEALLIETARLQGNWTSWWESGIHELECSNTGDEWTIRRLVYRPIGVVHQ